NKKVSYGQPLYHTLCPYFNKNASYGRPLYPILCPYLDKNASYGRPLYPILCPYLNKNASYGQYSALFLANIMIISYGVQAILTCPTRLITIHINIGIYFYTMPFITALDRTVKKRRRLCWNIR
ncbi:MAG: hypothetical protein J6X31_03170, partial [Bacteroidales bacterium]|nr:hypothetical protein [Bacteroidales bacterium]